MRARRVLALAYPLPGELQSGLWGFAAGEGGPQRPPHLCTSSPRRRLDARLDGGAAEASRAPPEPRMPRAYSDDLAWRVILRWRGYGHSVAQISDPEHGLAVSRQFVNDVIKRMR